MQQNGSPDVYYLIRYNMLSLEGTKLSRWARGDEKHDKARICGALEKVSACYFAYSVSSLCIFIDDFLHFWNCYWPQEKQWVFSRCLHLPRRDKVCLRQNLPPHFASLFNKSTYRNHTGMFMLTSTLQASPAWKMAVSDWQSCWKQGSVPRHFQ